MYTINVPVHCSLLLGPYILIECFFIKWKRRMKIEELTSPQLFSSCLVAHKAFTESLHFSLLVATVFTLLPSTIPILLMPFPFQPFASRWFLVFLLFFFLGVAKSLLCCSRWSRLSICPIIFHLSFPSDVLWGSLVTHSFLPHGRLLNTADIYVLDCLNKPISG